MRLAFASLLLLLCACGRVADEEPADGRVPGVHLGRVLHVQRNMKALLLVCALVSLAACGRSLEDESPATGAPDASLAAAGDSGADSAAPSDDASCVIPPGANFDGGDGGAFCRSTWPWESCDAGAFYLQCFAPTYALPPPGLLCDEGAIIGDITGQLWGGCCACN